MAGLVPIAQLGSRLAEHGRIRTGIKTPNAMRAIDTFRFTSADEQAIATLAEIYGGEPKPWSDPKASQRNQWEVITEASEIDVWLPPNALSQYYEMWTGGGCARRCDGVTCETPQRVGEDEYVMASVECICSAKGAMGCEVHTRLNVVLPQVRFGGTWRLDTKGWNAAHELPTIIDMIYGLQSQGLTVGVLKLEQRSKMVNGKKKNFVVPILLTKSTPEQIVSGQASALAISQAGTPQAMGELEVGEHDTDEVEVMDADLEKILSAALDLDDAPEKDAWDLVAEWGDDAERKARGLLEGKARWTKDGGVVKV